MSHRLTYLLITVFALLQGLQPLLHAHVGAICSGHAGIHFHVLPSATDTTWTETVLMNSAVPDLPSLTPPDNFRRTEQLLSTMTLAATDGILVGVFQQDARPATPTPATVQAAVPRNILPPTLAPPRFA